MQEQEIIDGNKLIAEFLCFKYRNQAKYWGRYPLDDNSFLSLKGEVEMHSLKFHSSWDWLMPVVEKIESLNFTTSIYHLPKTLNTVKILSGGADVVGVNGETKIEAIYKTVVEFIKWYNSCQK